MLGSASTEMLASLGDTTELARTDGAGTQSERAFDQYRDLLAGELGVELAEAESRCQDLAGAEVSADREAFRDVAHAVTNLLTAGHENAPTRERLSALRDEAWRSSLASDEPERELRASAPATTERYLDAEFVAIYW